MGKRFKQAVDRGLAEYIGQSLDYNGRMPTASELSHAVSRLAPYNDRQIKGPRPPKPTNHRKVYTKAKGSIPKGYEVHHIDGNYDNDGSENLAALPPIIHSLIHTRLRRKRYRPREWSI